MSYLDTRDLIDSRNELKNQILESFKDTFELYADETDVFEEILFEEEELENWAEDWTEELMQIKAIDALENEIGNEFEYGVILIPEDDFTEFIEQDLKDCGYIPKDIPSWIEIDWEQTAENVKSDYVEVKYQGRTYLARA